jgi:hypothetical protein
MRPQVQSQTPLEKIIKTAGKWKELEIIMLSEINQVQKNSDYILYQIRIHTFWNIMSIK